MSQNLANIPQLPYIGTPYGQPIGLRLPREKNWPPKSVRIDIDWALYGASSVNQQVGVSVQLVAQGATAPALDFIRSVYIDNTFSNVPVYVQFPDTLFTVVCPPGAVVMSPVATGVQQATIFAEGFIDADIPKVSVTFLNIETDGYYIPTSFEVAARMTFNGAAVDAVGKTQYTFLNVPEGVATPDRLNVITIGWRSVGAVSITGITLNGSPMSQTIGQATTRGCDIWQIPMPSLTAGPVIVTFSGATNYCGISSFSLYNLQNQVAQDTHVYGGTPNAAGPFDFSAGGLGIFSGNALTGGPNGPISWIGADRQVQQFFTVGANNDTISTAMHTSLVDELRNVSEINSGGVSANMNGATWR